MNTTATITRAPALSFLCRVAWLFADVVRSRPVPNADGSYTIVAAKELSGREYTLERDSQSGVQAVAINAGLKIKTGARTVWVFNEDSCITPVTEQVLRAGQRLLRLDGVEL